MPTTAAVFNFKDDEKVFSKLSECRAIWADKNSTDNQWNWTAQFLANGLLHCNEKLFATFEAHILDREERLKYRLVAQVMGI